MTGDDRTEGEGATAGERERERERGGTSDPVCHSNTRRTQRTPVFRRGIDMIPGENVVSSDVSPASHPYVRPVMSGDPVP